MIFGNSSEEARANDKSAFFGSERAHFELHAAVRCVIRFANGFKENIAGLSCSLTEPSTKQEVSTAAANARIEMKTNLAINVCVSRIGRARALRLAGPGSEDITKATYLKCFNRDTNSSKLLVT